MRILRARLNAAALLLSSSAILAAGGASAQTVPVLPLSQVPVPAPANLGDFVKDIDAARILGKALFWDMQVGSDGVQACATCHFRAGADPRRKNQVSPGLLGVVFEPDEAGNPTAAPNLAFEGQGPNYMLRAEDFPLRRLVEPTNRESAFTDKGNVVSSQGVHYGVFGQTGYPGPDPDGFYVGQGTRRANVRRVEPRNTPTMINAVFNHRNFWDMRAQNLFNGVNPFGDRDPNAFLYKADDPLNPERVGVLLDNSSLASQAVGPPTNRFEMSADGRTFPEVGDRLMREVVRRHRLTGRRLLFGRPLALQLVARNDSLLGPLSRAPLRGLSTTYEALIRRAFHRPWWDSPKFIRVSADGATIEVVDTRDTDPGTDEFTLLEFNFSLFFGLAVQAYEATLIADQTPFDKFLKDGTPLSEQAERGRQIFFNVATAPARGNCAFCHSGSLLSEAAVDVVSIRGLIRSTTSAGQTQLSDTGTRNIGVRETTHDLGNGGLDPFGHSLSIAVLDSSPAPNLVTAADGTFKIPGLRNVELTAPYFHHGGEATLLDVINFYVRGGSQGGATNPIVTRDPLVTIGGLSVLTTILESPNAEGLKADLVEFLKALTDDRVRRAAEPFDHPQIFVPNGHPGSTTNVIQLDHRAVDTFLEIPATGKSGGPILPGFLD